MMNITHWGMYFVPISDADEIENLFESLYFEEVKIPDYARWKPTVSSRGAP